MPSPQYSAELEVVAAESRDIAERLGHELTTAHLLLCLFTTKNQAAVFLSAWNIHADRVLEHIASRPSEKADTLDKVLRRAVDVARVGKTDTVTCLHVLVALCSFVDSAAYQLMKGTGAPISRMRTEALGHMQSHPAAPAPSPADSDTLNNEPHPADAEHHTRPQSTPRREPPRVATQTLSPPDSSGRRSARGLRRPPDVQQPESPAPSPPVADAKGDDSETAHEPSISPRAETDPDSAPSAARPSVTSNLAARLMADTQIAPHRSGKPKVQISAQPKRGTGSQVRRTDLILREHQFPLLCRFGRNLTLMAFDGKIDRVVGRDKEIDLLVDILNRRRSNNPVLVGEAGVGKTAVVEGLAHKIIGSDAEAPLPGMENRIVVELEAAQMLSNTSLRGSFAERLQALKKEVAKADGRVIVFLDELHHWIGMGAGGDGNTDGAGELKTALARGEFPCIGATTWEEYRKYVESDPAFERRFQVVRVSEPTPEQAIQILEGVIGEYAEHHKVTYDDDAVQAAVRLSHRYLPDRRLPDKALGIIDQAGSRARRLEGATVSKRLIAEVLADQAGLSADKLLMNDRERFIGLEDRLMARIIGQRHAIESVSTVLRRNYAGFVSGRPIGSFLFLGSTGVGKTEFARAMANVLFHDDDAMTRIDMSEFLESHSVARLIGAPPGYVGHEGGGQLTEAVRRRPYQLVLLDELEKAHPDVLNLLIQVLEDGRLTDSRGRTVDFTNVVIVMTSNLGAAAALNKSSRAAGFGVDTRPDDGVGHRERALDEARRHVRPELWNRFDETIVFDALSRDDVGRIARLQLTRSSERLGQERGITYACEPAVVEWLIDNGGYDPEMGARPMRRAIERHIEARIAEAIVHGHVVSPAVVDVVVEGGTLKLNVGPVAAV
jgi:ATP-dependent Clp protease ATP-binding subunit ClpC